MSKALLWLMLGLGIGLAAVVGLQLSPDARGVVGGVLIGMGASVPTCLLLIALLRQEHQPSAPAQPPAQPPAQLDPYPPEPRSQITVYDPDHLNGAYTALPAQPRRALRGDRRLL